jgi:hypothetical protein
MRSSASETIHKVWYRLPSGRKERMARAAHMLPARTWRRS